jgi:hypothetical protein
MAIAALTLAAGPALAVLQYVFARAQADVMPIVPVALSGGLTSVVTVSTVLPVVALFVPLLIIAVLAYGLANAAVIRTQSRPPIFTLPGAGAVARIRSAVVAASVPEQYRSIVNLPALEAAAAAGRPLLWLASLAALGFAITR